MTNEEKIATYRQAIFLATAAARVLAGQDIPALLASIDRADSIGSLLDPTLWMQKSPAMEEDRKLLRAALPLHQFGKMLVEKFPDPT